MADADYGYVGKGPGTIALYRGREEIERVPQEQGVETLIKLIKADGRWVEPEESEKEPEASEPAELSTVS